MRWWRKLALTGQYDHVWIVKQLEHLAYASPPTVLESAMMMECTTPCNMAMLSVPLVGVSLFPPESYRHILETRHCSTQNQFLNSGKELATKARFTVVSTHAVQFIIQIDTTLAHKIFTCLPKVRRHAHRSGSTGARCGVPPSCSCFPVQSRTCCMLHGHECAPYVRNCPAPTRRLIFITIGINEFGATSAPPARQQTCSRAATV